MMELILLGAAASAGVCLVLMIRARAELRAVKRALSDMQALLKSRGRLAQELAHEIRNPISAILCSAETLDLLIGSDLEPVHRKALNYIRDYGEHLLHLVTDYLDLSRIESGATRAEPRAVDLRKCIESICGLLASLASRKQVHLEQRWEGPRTQAFIDPLLLKQVVFNLAHNAVKFSPECGVVTIRVINAQDGLLKISVIDQGPGIDPARRAALEDEAVSLGAEGERGFGLGLPLVRALLKLFGSRLSIESPQSGGSVFSFGVPACSGQCELAASESGEEAREHQPLVGKRFLVVDRSDAMRDALAQLIMALGGAVEHVGRAADAVQALGRRTFDAVVLDESADGMTAAEIARMLSHEIKDGSTKLIVTSGSDEERDEIRRLDCGVLVDHPLTSKALIQSLAIPRKNVS